MNLESMTRAELAAELAHANARIGRAYWTFTRSVRGRPPSLTVPDAYADRTAIENEQQRRKEHDTMKQQALNETLAQAQRQLAQHSVLSAQQGEASPEPASGSVVGMSSAVVELAERNAKLRNLLASAMLLINELAEETDDADVVEQCSLWCADVAELPAPVGVE